MPLGIDGIRRVMGSVDLCNSFLIHLSSPQSNRFYIMRKKICDKAGRQQGFTLVELLVGMVIGSIALWGIYTAFQSQQRSYIVQEEVTEMRQEVGASMEIMSREIRNAGHDETPAKTAGAGIVVAGPYQFQFTMDITDNTGPDGSPDGDIADQNEDVTFQLSNVVDADGNGIADSGAGELGRDVGGGLGLEALSSNIHAIGFAYAYDSDADGQLEVDTVYGGGYIVWAVPDGGGGWVDLNTSGDLLGTIDVNDPTPLVMGTATLAQLQEIRAVRIWILARASRPDPEFSDTRTYKVGVNVISAPNDNYRRRLSSGIVRCRNIGLQ